MEYATKILIADENAQERQKIRDNLARAGYRKIEEGKIAPGCGAH